MATILDTGLISFLLPVFVFLFILVVIYAILGKTELFGKTQTTLNLLAAICVAAVSVFAGNMIKVIGSIIPWIVFIALVLVLVFAIYMAFGKKEKEIWDTFGGPTVITVIIIFIVLIGLIAVFESDITPFSGTSQVSSDGKIVQGQNVKNEVIATLTHPRLLGALFLLMVTVFTAKLLVDKLEP